MRAGSGHLAHGKFFAVGQLDDLISMTRERRRRNINIPARWVILGVWGVQIEIAPLTSGGSIPWDGRKHWFPSNTQLSLMAPRPFFSHILVTASAGGRNLVRGWYIFNLGAAKLFLSPLKGHDEDTAKKQHAGSMDARINDDRAPHCKTPGSGR